MYDNTHSQYMLDVQCQNQGSALGYGYVVKRGEFMDIARNLDSPKSLEKPKRTAVPTLLNGLTVLSLIAAAVILYMSLIYAGTDITQGNVQRIFYVHVGSFAGAATAFFVSVVGAIVYLRGRNNRWDVLSVASIEVGLMLSVVTLITGSIWARPTWNTWWTWDPRLTSAAIMALTYAAYLMLRAGIENPDKRRLFASVYAILAISTVIFTTIIIRIRPDTIHPAVIGPSPVNAEGGFMMAENMSAALGTSAALMTLVITPTLIWWRIRLENMLEAIQKLQVKTLSS